MVPIDSKVGGKENWKISDSGAVVTHEISDTVIFLNTPLVEKIWMHAEKWTFMEKIIDKLANHAICCSNINVAVI
ncbi:MAG: hypothetical protein HQM01_09660 [Magnetococcales bacterium]|nr:hypothetical protein [Magnetococcales bacterium]